MAVDFLGKELRVGDTVIIVKQGYRDFAIGRILSITHCFANIEYQHQGISWKFKQPHSQIIKLEEPLHETIQKA